MMTTTAAMFAQRGDWGDHMGWDGGWWMMVWGTLMMAAFVVLVVWLVRSTGAGAPGPGTGAGGDPLGSARRILAERYARGELSSEEYRERLDNLG